MTERHYSTPHASSRIWHLICIRHVAVARILHHHPALWVRFCRLAESNALRSLVKRVLDVLGLGQLIGQYVDLSTNRQI